VEGVGTEEELGMEGAGEEEETRNGTDVPEAVKEERLG
jgi:hypothetical protein